MRVGKIFLGLFTVILICLIFLVSVFEEPFEDKPFSPSFFVYTEANGNREEIYPWQNSDGEYWIFLPGYALMEQTVLVCREDIVCIDDIPVQDGGTLHRYEWNTAYLLSCSSEEGSIESTITFVRSGGVPSLYVDVQSGNMEYIHMEKGNEETGTMRLYDANGEVLFSGELSSVKGRGNTSWYSEKKPYNITLAQEADIMGMGAARRWILLAEGGNQLNIRNKIVYDFADRVGLEHTPDGEWVDLYLNGTYTGLYLLSERNEVHPNRINISPENSFVISMEHQVDMDKQSIPYVELGSTQVLRIRSTSMSNQELYQIWKTLRNALLSEDGRDPMTGKHWMDLIDLDSWVRKYLVEEVFANPDGGAVSQYFYMDDADPEKKIIAGPIWDYDYSMAGEGWWMSGYPGFMTMAREYTDDGMYLPWFYELYQKEEFYSRLTELYETEFRAQILELAETGLERYENEIFRASVTDGIRWGYTEAEIREELEFISTFLIKHERFLTDMWLSGTQYHIVRVQPYGYSSGYFAVKDGDLLPQIPVDESPNSLGWYEMNTEEPFDITQPIYEDVQIYEKREESQLPKIHFIPILIILVAIPCFLLYDVRQTRKSGRQRYDPAKVNEIPS